MTWRRTSVSWVTQRAAMRPCSRARTRSRRPGASLTRFSTAPRLFTSTRPARGDRPTPSASSPPSATGTIRRNRQFDQGGLMEATQRLHELGQSLWLDNITRKLVTSGTLKRYRDELSITGLTSNPTIFDQAIKGSADYDADIRKKLAEGKSGEPLFFELALSDLTQAAYLFPPIPAPTAGAAGWVSLAVPPRPASHAKSTIPAAKALPAQGGKPNLFIKIPGTPEGLPAIEESIFNGVPINVTLLFSREHYVAAAEA